MLEITVRNTENDDTVTFTGDFALINSYSEEECGVRTSMMGSASATDIVQVLIAQDTIRENIFEEHPMVKLAYEMRDMLFNVGAMVDLTEMRRQMEDLDDE